MKAEWTQDPTLCAVLFHLLVGAEDGMISISRRVLSRESGISERKIRTAIERLCHLGILSKATQETTQKTTQETTQPKYAIKGYRLNIYKDENLKNDPENDPRNDPENDPTKRAPTRKPKGEDIDFDAFVNFFNSKVLETRIPQVKTIAEKRRETIRARMKVYGKQALADVIVKAVGSDFLNGRKSDWHATFDWLFAPKNFAKVIDGNYDNENSGHDTSRLTELGDAIRKLESSCGGL